MLVWDILPVTYHFIFSRVKAEGGGLIIWEEFGSPSAVLSFADANTTLLWGGISSSSARLWFLSGNPNNHDNRRTERKSIKKTVKSCTEDMDYQWWWGEDKLYNVTVVGCSSSIPHIFFLFYFSVSIGFSASVSSFSSFVTQPIDLLHPHPSTHQHKTHHLADQWCYGLDLHLPFPEDL